MPLMEPFRSNGMVTAILVPIRHATRGLNTIRPLEHAWEPRWQEGQLMQGQTPA